MGFEMISFGVITGEVVLYLIYAYLFLFGITMLQNYLPLNPQNFPGISP